MCNKEVVKCNHVTLLADIDLRIAPHNGQSLFSPSRVFPCTPMLSNLWKALWGNKSSNQQTRQDIEQTAQRLSQFPWVPENHTALPPPTQEHHVAPLYGSSNSFTQQSLPLPAIRSNSAIHQWHKVSKPRSLRRVRPRQEDEETSSKRERRVKRRREAAKQQRQHVDMIPATSSASSSTPSPPPPASSEVPSSTMTEDPLPFNTTNIASSSSSSSSSHPQHPYTISREPVSYAEFDEQYLTLLPGLPINETEMSVVIKQMLHPDVWDHLGGNEVQQWIEVPRMIPRLKELFGMLKRGNGCQY